MIAGFLVVGLIVAVLLHSQIIAFIILAVSVLVLWSITVHLGTEINELKELHEQTKR